MPQVKVWNDNGHDYKERFKGIDIVIPAKTFVEMEYEEAIDFKGSYSNLPPPDFSGDESIYYKMIRVETPPPNSIYKDESLINHMTGKKASSAEELRASLAELRQFLVNDPDAEKAKPSAKDNDRIAHLEAQIAELMAAKSEKKSPGRPRKEA